MSSVFFWQIPTAGDGRYAEAGASRRGERTAAAGSPYIAVSDPRGNAFNYFDYLHQIARAAELSGFDGLQIRHDVEGDESWIVAGYLARSTRSLQLLTEFEASRGSAVYAAKNAASYQRFSGGRFAWQISRGGDAAQRRQQGDFVSDKEVTPRIEEFLTVAQGVLTEAPFNFKGTHFEVLEGGFKGPLSRQTVPPVYLSGQSDADYALSARRANVHLFDAQSVAALGVQIGKLAAASSATGRTVAIGLRIDLLARETAAEALHDAHRYWQQSGRADAANDAPGDDLLWQDFATARTGATAALVGSYEEIATQLAAYAAAGVSHFVLSAIPHLEEAYRIGAHVLPAVRALVTPPAAQPHAAA